jgi:cellulose synthase/poly-beta-1,6-N-acetylglucosamine synthase-like glycosyltransferase
MINEDAMAAPPNHSPDEGESLARSKPRVSVVIRAHRRTELLRKAVLSVFEQDLAKDEYELIVADNAPDDRNVSLVRELQSVAPCRLQCVTSRGEGPGPSRNLGVRHARADIIAFTDSDCEASPGWLRHGLAAFQDGIGIVQGKTLPDPTVPHGVFTHYILVEKESFWYETANIFYRREALERSGGFPEDLNPNNPFFGEDTQVAWAVKRLGWKTRFCSEAVIYHAVRPVPVWRWVVIRSLYVAPYVLGRVPELRRFMFCSYFFDRAQALFLPALIGIFIGVFHPVAFVLAIPYLLLRVSEPSRTLHGALRLIRVPAYGLRDFVSFLILSAGSLRFRSLLL